MSLVIFMFERRYLVGKNDVDDSKRLNISRLMEHLNDIMELNAESYGAGAQWHLERDLAWVLAEYAIEVKRLPLEGEMIHVGTRPYSFKRSFGYRLYRVRDEEGETIIEGKGKFLLINIRTKAIVRPSSDMLAKFTDARKEPTSLSFPKWPDKQGSFIKAKTLTVTDADIDQNGHMNNARYVRHAGVALKESGEDFRSLKGIHVRYRKEAFKGDELHLSLHRLVGGFYVAIRRQGELTTEIMFIH